MMSFFYTIIVVKNMRKYYLFIIKNNYYNKYQYSPYILYKALYYLYKMNRYDLENGLYLYNKVCNIIGKNVILNYIKNKFDYKVYSDKIIRLNSVLEKTYVQVNYSCIIIMSNINYPYIFKILNIYNKKIFVCDFINGDYFFLKETINSEFYKVNTYNKLGG